MPHSCKVHFIWNDTPCAWRMPRLTYAYHILGAPFKSYRSWTYEFCYKGAIRQYYEADTDENKQPHKYAPVYVLGRFRPLLKGPKSLEEHKDTKLDSWLRREAKTEFETKHDRNYLVQTWEHGDICILTNQPRQIRVHVSVSLVYILAVCLYSTNFFFVFVL